MTTQRQTLLEELQRQGWEVLEACGPDPECWVELEWWADEVWLLKPHSWLRPHGTSAEHDIYLTFVVDPMWEGPRRKGQGVWAVTASLAGPQQRSDMLLSLRRGWQEELHAFLADLSKLAERQAPDRK